MPTAGHPGFDPKPPISPSNSHPLLSGIWMPSERHFSPNAALLASTHAPNQPHIHCSSTANDDGTETVAPCPDAVVTTTVQYYEDPTLFTDGRTAAELALIDDMTGLSSVQSISGVVVLGMSGADPQTNALPCAPGSSCGITLGLPLSAPAAPAASRRRLLQQLNSSSQIVCLRMADSEFVGFSPDTNSSTAAEFPVSMDLANGTATCTTTRSGT